MEREGHCPSGPNPEPESISWTGMKEKNKVSDMQKAQQKTSLVSTEDQKKGFKYTEEQM